MILSGTIINVITVLAGSSLGLLFRSKLPKAVIERVFQAIGLFTLVLGAMMAIKTENVLVLVFSLVLGAVVGQAINLERKIENGANRFKRLVAKSHDRFSEGLVTAFLLFCAGSMTILGSINEGIGNGSTLLYSKAVLDGFASIALAGSLGIGVLFSAIPLLIFQGGLTLLAFYFGNFLSPEIILAISSTGGVLLIGLGFKLLHIKDINILNILPALLFSPLFIYLLSLING